ncbi:MAG: hypothetical protein ABIK21_09645, partial [bacterium]
MNAKKILAMILVLSLLVIGGVMQIAANGTTPQGQSEEKISGSTNAQDSDDIQEELEGQDADGT